MKPLRATLSASPFITQDGQHRACAIIDAKPTIITFPKDPGHLEKGDTVEVDWTMTSEYRARVG